VDIHTYREWDREGYGHSTDELYGTALPGLFLTEEDALAFTKEFMKRTKRPMPTMDRTSFGSYFGLARYEQDNQRYRVTVWVKHRPFATDPADANNTDLFAYA
jgi:hypothetical protein